MYAESFFGGRGDTGTCAKCGKDGNALRACTACKRGKYCSQCQKDHVVQHIKEECDGSNSVKVMLDNIAPLLDSFGICGDDLFNDAPPKEECPICLLAMPFASRFVSRMNMPCCGKIICGGCVHAASQEMDSNSMQRCCPFCRESLIVPDDEVITKRWEKRMKGGDAHAFYMMGCSYRDGSVGVSQDSAKANELFRRAAELGSLHGHFHLGKYHGGLEGVDNMNMEKALYHFAAAAMGGHEAARYTLGYLESKKGSKIRAMRHFMIAASAGHDESLKKFGEGYRCGHVSKDDYAKTLRAHKDSQDEMKSDQRAKAAAAENLFVE